MPEQPSRAGEKDQGAGPESMAGLPAMGWVEHLAELRWRIIVSLAALVAGAGVGAYLASPTLDLLRRAAGVDTLVFVTPAEGFLTWVRLALAIGVVLAIPVAAWQAWRFVAPGLFPHERRTLRRVLPLAAALAVLGLAFGLLVVFPVLLRLLLAAGGGWLSAVPAQQVLSAGRLVSFLLTVTWPFVLVFQLPVVLVVLLGWGVVTCARLREMRRAAYVLAFIVGGVLTPNSVVAQLLMAIPLVGLYELTVALAGWWRLEGRWLAGSPHEEGARWGERLPAPDGGTGVNRTEWSTGN